MPITIAFYSKILGDNEDLDRAKKKNDPLAETIYQRVSSKSQEVEPLGGFELLVSLHSFDDIVKQRESSLFE